MTRWEYKQYAYGQHESNMLDIIEELNAIGAEGWEAFGVTLEREEDKDGYAEVWVTYHFKRLILDSQGK